MDWNCIWMLPFHLLLFGLFWFFLVSPFNFIVEWDLTEQTKKVKYDASLQKIKYSSLSHLILIKYISSRKDLHDEIFGVDVSVMKRGYWEDFINPFKHYVQLLRSTPSSYALRQALMLYAKLLRSKPSFYTSKRVRKSLE